MRWPVAIKTRRGKLDLAALNVVRRRFARYARPHWKVLIVASVATLGAVGMGLAAPWPIKFIFDIVLSDAMATTMTGRWFAAHAPTPAKALVAICASILVIALLESVFAYLRDVLLAQTGQKVVGKLRHDLFAHMQRLSPDVFESRRTGDLLMRLTGDIQMLRQMIVNAWVTAAENMLRIVATLAVMFWLNPLLAAIASLMLPVSIWWMLKLSARIRHAAKSQREKESFVLSIAHEVIGAMMLVQAFNREKTERKRFARQNRSSIRAGVKMTRLEAKLFGIVSISSAAALCAVLFVGVRSVLAGGMTAGDLLVFVAYMRSISKPVRKLSKLASQTAKATICGMRIAEILSIPPTIADRSDAVVADRFAGGIDFDNVEFVYPNGTPALNVLSLRIEPGQRVAIVGESGAGKSTLLKLLLRFYDPTAGTVRIDGTDIRTVTVASLRDQIAIVQQETVLFGLTIAENISLGFEEVEMAAVRRVAKAVDAHAFIEELPEGYETVLSERGTTLSGGQRQRIALARALLRNTPILVLDEPATGLDPVTAGVAARSWMNGDDSRTILVICHQLDAMARFDKIAVLSRGQVVDEGTHSSLLERCDVYAELYRAHQMQGYGQRPRDLNHADGRQRLAY